jgi:hypothetical protein
VANQSVTPELAAYREWLVKTDHSASEAYDKAVMTLSGGALAISISFVREIAPSPLEGTMYWLCSGGWLRFERALQLGRVGAPCFARETWGSSVCYELEFSRGRFVRRERRSPPSAFD